jgi:hypothetical protein
MNEKPSIEKKLIGQRNKLIGFTSFLGIGIGAASVDNLGLTGIGFLSPLIILGFEAYYFKKMIADNQEYKRNAGLLTKPFLKRNLNGWIKEYIENSDSMVHKKYKAVFLGLWLSQRRLGFKTLLDYDTQYLQDLSDKIIDSNISKFSILDITRDNNCFSSFSVTRTNTTQHSTTQKLDGAILEDFLQEDIHKNKNIEVAKEIYSEYAKQGIATKFLNTNLDNFLSCMFLQNYKFSDIDYENINKMTKIAKKDNNYWLGNFRNFKDQMYFINDQKISQFDLIIEQEDKKENLYILKDFFKAYTEGVDPDQSVISKSIKAPNPLSYLISSIDKKLQYLDISNILVEKNDKINKQIQRNKI